MKNILLILLALPLIVFGQGVPIEYQLTSGWNMVGFTACEITPIEEAVNNALGNGSSISNTFSIIKDIRGKFWHSSLGEYSSLTQLTPGEGYMMYVNGEPTTVQFSEDYCNDITYQLNSGWNLVAFTGDVNADSNIWTSMNNALVNSAGIYSTIEVIKNASGQFWSPNFEQLTTFTPGQAYVMYVNSDPWDLTTVSFTDNSTQIFQNNPGEEFYLPTTDNNMSIVFPEGILNDFIGGQIFATINGQRVSENSTINEDGSVGIAIMGNDWNSWSNFELADPGDLIQFEILLDGVPTIYVENNYDITYVSHGIETITSVTFNGCTDSNACNYVFYATNNDGSCMYLDYEQSLFNACCLENSITTICIIDDEICGDTDIDCITYGCNEQWADNYDPFITENDGSCDRMGCTSSWADNYDDIATTNDSSCFKFGCTFDWADNYDVEATNDTSCYRFGCTFDWADNYDELATEDNDSCYLYGCNSVCAENYDSLATINDGTCFFIGLEESNDNLNYTNTLLYEALNSWNITIELQVGWNIFGYGCPIPIDVVEGLSNHTESIMLVKDNNGSVYMPEFGFNGIGDLTPGYGYQIKISGAIEDFSLCEWYVNDIPEDNIVSLQDYIVLLEDSIELLNGPIYEVGDLTEGGIVFYIDESGEHGLVAALEDLTDGATMGDYGTEEGFEWGCYQQYVNGADGIAIGAGYQNTMDIVNQVCETVNGGTTAAQAALDAYINGYSDWYLPSKGELVEMYNTIGNGGPEGNIGGFETSNYPYYWSSLENYSYSARGVDFNDGSTDSLIDKNHSLRVRAVRAF